MIKYIAASIWALASCFFLWFFAYVTAWPVNPGNSAYFLRLDDLFLSYVMFTLVVTLGGASYYVMTKIIEAPYLPADRDNWLKLIKFLMAVLIVEFFIPLTLIYQPAAVMGGSGDTFFIITFVLTWLAVMFLMQKSVSKMRDMQLIG